MCSAGDIPRFLGHWSIRSCPGHRPLASSTRGFVSVANLQNLARQASILVILALGETWIILLGSIDLSIEGSMALSSVAVGMLAQST